MPFRILFPSTNGINAPFKKRAEALVGIIVLKELPISLDESLELGKELLDRI